MEPALRTFATVLWALVSGMGVGEAVIIIPGVRRAGSAAGLRSFEAMGRFGWKIAPALGATGLIALVALVLLLGDDGDATARLTLLALVVNAAAIFVALAIYRPADRALFELSEDAPEQEYLQRLTRVHRPVIGRAVLYIVGLVLLVLAPLV